MSKHQHQSPTALVWHVAVSAEVAAARASGVYQSASLAGEGFIHCSSHEQIGSILQAFYPQCQGLVLLLIDPARLRATLKWEAAAVPPGLSLPVGVAAVFPHIYGLLNLDAVVDEVAADGFEPADYEIDPETRTIIDHFKFQRLPVEGTLFVSTWRSEASVPGGGPLGTAMIGLYSNQPKSLSCFHRLTHDEIWHVYGGDPFRLVLLYPDGSSEDIIMGTEPLLNQRVQFRVPAGVWQAGHLLDGGRYALFGCTMAPGFSGECFEAGVAGDLIGEYPEREDDILMLSINGGVTRMPPGFAE